MTFVDSGAFLAWYYKQDQHHRRANSVWDELRDSGERLVTSNFVLDETFTLLARWAGYRFAVEQARSIYASTILTIVRPSLDDELQALVHFEKYADQKVSFTDCVSFSLMQREGVTRVFSFDAHFQRAGFQVVPTEKS